MALEDFFSLRQTVLSDESLQENLRAFTDEAGLFEAVLALARERGIAVTNSDLRAIVNANRRGWLERWLYQ
jgi:hypothetical protein